MSEIINVKKLFTEFRSPAARIRVPAGSLKAVDWIESKRTACKKLKPLFDPDKLDELAEDKFREFLSFEANRVMEVRRVAPKILADMQKLRRALKVLTDEPKDVRDRLNEALKVPGMGRAIASLILHIHNPEQYSVWSSPKENVLKALGFIGSLTGTYGDQYLTINEAEKSLSSDLDVDLIELDAFLWWIYSEEKLKPPEEERLVTFEAEKELRNFLGIHPYKIEKGFELVKGGVEYETDVGRIDLLCVDEKGNHVVVELKKVRDSDRAVGQLLRYMGWVRENLAKGKDVKGIIITHEYDEKLDYAAKAFDNIHARYYAIKFELSDEPFEV